MNKKLLIILAILVIGGLVYFIKVNDKINELEIVPDVVSNISTTTQVASTSTAPVVVKPKVLSLQTNPYVDNDSRFSIKIFQGWIADTISRSATTSVTWFYNSLDTKDNIKGKIVVKKVERDSKSDKLLVRSGIEGLGNLVAFNLKSELNGYKFATSTKFSIKDQEFLKMSATYIAVKSQKEVTQNLFVTLSENAYYLIIMDIYTEDWIKNGNMYLKSVETFKTLI